MQETKRRLRKLADNWHKKAAGVRSIARTLADEAAATAREQYALALEECASELRALAESIGKTAH